MINLANCTEWVEDEPRKETLTAIKKNHIDSGDVIGWNNFNFMIEEDGERKHEVWPNGFTRLQQDATKAKLH